MILAADIGGTNSRLALFDEKLSKQTEHTFRNEGRSSFTEIVREFLASAASSQAISRAAIGVAGPVKNGHASMTNLPWKLGEQELSRDLAIPKIALINDLVAHAEGIELLKPEQMITIQHGDSVRGNRAVIAAGTGLGEAGIFWDAQQRGYRPFPSEGGHGDFAPRDQRQIALLRYIRGRYPNASWERVLSGPGLRNLYDFLIAADQLGPSSALTMIDPKPADITSAAMRNQSRACVEALELFVTIYGAESANLALKLLAVGGVYLAGGIAPHIADKLASPTFVEAFCATGPQNIRALLRQIPIHIVNFELNGLYGAANHASRL
jgi:glucokinase